MMLAKKCRIIAILTQNLSNACGALWNFRQIPRKARGDINDIACRHSMLIAASEQGSTCGGTNAGRVETIIAQARIGQTLEIGGGDWPHKNAGGGENGSIGHDEEAIGGALRCLNGLLPRTE